MCCRIVGWLWLLIMMFLAIANLALLCACAFAWSSNKEFIKATNFMKVDKSKVNNIGTIYWGLQYWGYIEDNPSGSFSSDSRETGKNNNICKFTDNGPDDQQQVCTASTAVFALIIVAIVVQFFWMLTSGVICCHAGWRESKHSRSMSILWCAFRCGSDGRSLGNLPRNRLASSQKELVQLELYRILDPGKSRIRSRFCNVGCFVRFVPPTEYSDLHVAKDDGVGIGPGFDRGELFLPFFCVCVIVFLLFNREKWLTQNCR